MLTSKNLYFLYLWILYEIPSSLADTITIVFPDTSTIDPSPPPQTACLSLKAFLNDSNLISKMPQEWVVTRTTPRTTLPETVKGEPDINCCSPTSWLKSCAGRKGGIHILREWDRKNNGDLVKITKAYSERFKNIVVFTEPQGPVDQYYNVLGGFGTSMHIYTEGQTKTQDIPVNKFPTLVLYVQARKYTMTMYGFQISTDKIVWALYQNCDEDMAWIEVASSVIQSNGLDAVNTSINEALKQKTVPRMEAVPLGLPFKTGS